MLGYWPRNVSASRLVDPGFVKRWIELAAGAGAIIPAYWRLDGRQELRRPVHCPPHGNADSTKR